ncbi:MAG TPA: hypothetical protein VND01_00785, partial [Candidatus Acidoferrales bacterium]|nr:hypothetical protein [Candidatus Acidoferrales bacterium]
FLAILGFVGLAFMVLGSLMFIVVGSAVTQQAKLPAFFGPGFGILELLLALVYFFPCLYLLRYANAITRIQDTGQAALEDALKQQKSFWKYMGIFAIIVIAVYVLCIIGGIAFAIIYGSIHHP